MGKRQVIDKTAQSPAAPDVLYELLLHRQGWPEWSPLGSFEHERDGDDGPDSVGAVGTFTTGRTRAREEIVELVPGRRLSYRLLSGMRLSDYRADVDLVAVDGGTTIRWRSTFGAPWGTGWAYRLALGTFIGRCAKGLAAEGARRVAMSPAA